MGKADLHVHTHHSDGQPTVRELLDHVRLNTDLDIIAITDHDTIAGALEAQTMAQDYGLQVIIGEEVTSIDGHVVGLFLHERVAPGQTVEATVAHIHEQGGLAFAPHPFYRNGFFSNKGYTMMGLGQRLVEAEMDGIEVLNSTPTLKWANDKAAAFADKHERLARMANSDAHIARAVGKSYTHFSGTTAAELRTAMETRTTMPGAEAYELAELLRYLDFWLRAMKMGIPGSRKYGVGAVAARQPS